MAENRSARFVSRIDELEILTPSKEEKAENTKKDIESKKQTKDKATQ